VRYVYDVAVVEKRWQPGEVILMEEYLQRPRRQLINVRPQVVVEDREDYLAIVSLSGAPWATRDEPGRTAMPVEDRIALYLKEELTRAWYERTVTGAVLTLHPPGVAHCIRLFWDSDWHFRNWYVNLEVPYRRMETGIQVCDHTLDVVATPALEWSWKDEPEFVALVNAWDIPIQEAGAIRAEGERAIHRIEKREWPFNEPWPDWRPDPTWAAPRLSDYWKPPDV